MNNQRKRNQGKTAPPRYNLGSATHPGAVQARVEGFPTLIASGAGGLIQVVYPISITNIGGFTSRFGSTFDEYRILKCTMNVSPVSATSSGVTKAWYDEKSIALPTLVESQQRLTVNLPNFAGNSKSTRNFVWKASDPLDFEFTAIGTAVNAASFKLYSDLVNYGTPATTNIWLLEPVFEIEFRGLKSL